MILWVEDNADLRLAVAEALVDAGHRVVPAGSAEEALARLDADDTGNPLDLLLTDLRLPGMDGLELARELRRRHGPSLPVLLVTSHAGAQDLRPWRADAAFRMLLKPLEILHLHQLVAELLAGAGAAMAGETTGPPSTAADPGPPATPALTVPPASRSLWLRGVLAGCFVVAFLVLARLSLAPNAPSPLPDRPAASGTERSGVVEILEPFGPVAGVPQRFAWRPTIGADRYLLEVTDVEGRTLWRGDSAEVEVSVPADLAERLRPLAAYLWRVQAVDGTGALLARSESARFRIIEPADPRQLDVDR